MVLVWRGGKFETSLISRRTSRTQRCWGEEKLPQGAVGSSSLGSWSSPGTRSAGAKTLHASGTGGERVTVVSALDERDEADFVTEEIVTRRSQANRLLRDLSVLYRTNSQSRALEEAFRKRAIAYRLVGSVRFYDRREIRDLMSYLKLVANPNDDEAFRRAVAVPKRGMGDTTIEALAAAAREERIPMLAAAARPGLLPAIRASARTGLAEFAAMILRFRARAQDAAVDELLREIVLEIRYDDHLKAEGPEGIERLENVRELITGAIVTQRSKMHEGDRIFIGQVFIVRVSTNKHKDARPNRNLFG